VQPASTTISAGQTVQLIAVLKDANGTPLSSGTIVWASAAAAVATVSDSGLVHGVAAGAATITASSGSKSDVATVTVTAGSPLLPSSDTATFVGAGDIASCSSDGDEGTAKLLDGIPGTVFTAGDNAYSDGSALNFTNCYQPSWGKFKDRTRPSPGNHDYHTSNGSDYYAYYGANAGPAGRGYYSYDLGTWHIVSLNSNVSMSAESAQEQWLRADLAASTARCTLAYWHHPRFSSGTKHGSFAAAQSIWQALYDARADVVVSGHEHNYERFAPQDADGTADPTLGLREFVVGTGGASHYDDEGTPKPNSEVFNGTTWGVLRLTLEPASYRWEFVPVAGEAFHDSGTGQCH
jgi:Big-like domain-containing protein/calcineurin-like phosphoesterase family protein